MVEEGRPLIVQSDHTVLLEVGGPGFEEARDDLARFAELVKSPEYVHTYRITPLSLWNAAAAGLGEREVVASLRRFSRFQVPTNVESEIRDQISRFGRLVLIRGEEGELILESDTPALLTMLRRQASVGCYLGPSLGPGRAVVTGAARGHLKQALIKVGYPVDDWAGYTQGDPMSVSLRSTTVAGLPFALRGYQRLAVDAFYAGGTNRGGSGVVVLPCGAGKTMVGLAAMERVGAKTLILATSVAAARQWQSEILDKTSLTREEVGEYSGERKEILPVTAATYQIITHRPTRDAAFVHLGLFDSQNWGLIVYDEVHLLPAPLFRITAEIQARRRLGLTATLVREDGREDDVFSLIGPKKFDVPWKDLEVAGWIAEARCVEIRVPLSNGESRLEYATAGQREQARLAAVNPAKVAVIQELLACHAQDRVLVIGQYLDQLRAIASQIHAPLVTGQTANQVRQRRYDEFKAGRIPVLVVSKVANFAIDLPEANVAIQVSGAFGSRQEEAQRLGRILRPKKKNNQATFYSLVSKETVEERFAAKRQLFLTEQGYKYEIRLQASG